MCGEICVSGSHSRLPPQLSAEVLAYPSSDISYHPQLLADKEKGHKLHLENTKKK